MKILEYSHRETYFGVRQVVGMSLYFFCPCPSKWDSSLPPPLAYTVIAIKHNESCELKRWCIPLSPSCPTQWLLPTAPLVHRHGLRPSEYVLLQAQRCQQDPRCHPAPLPWLPGIPKDIRYWNEPMLMSTPSQFPHRPRPDSTKFERLRIYQKKCSKCTQSHWHCIFESPSHLLCTWCIKMHLLCYFQYSGESFYA